MKIFKYTKPDISRREVQKLGTRGDHIVTDERYLYNQNLTAHELCLLRRLMWDYKEWKKTARYPGEFDLFIQTWLFTDKKKLVLYSDILDDIENGTLFDDGK